MATFINSDTVVVNNFSFMIAVPKYVTLQIKPASGTQLLPLGQKQYYTKIAINKYFAQSKTNDDSCSNVL